MGDKLYLTWDDVGHAVEEAREAIIHCPLLTGPLTGVYGVPRGGLVLAVALSHTLGVPLIWEPQPNCALVDDVLETGHTMQQALDLAATICKGQGITVPNVATWVWISKNRRLHSGYGRYVDPSTWVVFPWEDWLRADLERKAYYERAARTVPST